MNTFLTGTKCDQLINPCAEKTDKCENDSKCINQGMAIYDCQCQKGYSGEFCEKDTKECDSNRSFGLFEDLPFDLGERVMFF